MNIMAGPVSRTRTSQKKYNLYQKSEANKTVCSFCEFTETDSRVVMADKHFFIINNIFGYDVWDGCGVSEHLMIVPKRHIHSISELTSAETKMYMNHLAAYESRGYSIYSRAPDNITKSVAHLHTHLLKLDNKRKNAILYLRKPHVMVYK